MKKEPIIIVHYMTEFGGKMVEKTINELTKFIKKFKIISLKYKD